MPIPRKPITPKTPLECRKAFKINGRPMQPGDPFDWRRMSVDWRRARLLYEGGFVVVRAEGETSLVLSDLEQIYVDGLSEGDREAFYAAGLEEQIELLEELMDEEEEDPADKEYADDESESETAEETEPEQTEETPEPEKVEETQPEQTPDAVTAEAVHQGGGWYDVVAGDKTINESKLRKADAQKLADEHNAAGDSLLS